MQRATAISALLIFVSMTQASCGDREIPVVANSLEFAVVTPPGAAGRDEEPAAVPAVRLLPNGQVQAMVESGRCLAVSRVNAEESETSITLSAHTVSTTDDPCAMDIVRVYVSLSLGSEVGKRTFKDASTGMEVRLVRCDEEPNEPICTDQR